MSARRYLLVVVVVLMLSNRPLASRDYLGTYCSCTARFQAFLALSVCPAAQFEDPTFPADLPDFFPFGCTSVLHA